VFNDASMFPAPGGPYPDRTSALAARAHPRWLQLVPVIVERR